MEKPNFVLILLDDLGYADLGCQGSPDIRTPHIDRLAASGIRFTDGYVPVSVCGPSRASLMTGRYSAAFGIQGNGEAEAGIPLQHKTIAEILRARGYATQALGKWHLGHSAEQTPMARGFDEFCGHLAGGSHYFPFSPGGHKWNETRERASIQKNDRPIGVGDLPPETYLTDLFTDEAVAFIERPRAVPFFIYLAFNAPHGPIMAPDHTKLRNDHIPEGPRRTLAGMMSAVDDGVGRIVEALDRRGIRDTTFIVLLSDNGAPTRINASLNTPLRGQKGDVWEGGVRIPFMLSWPARIAPGQVRDAPVCSIDLMPTFLAAAGIEAAEPFDGVDLLPWLTGTAPGVPRERLFFWRAGRRAVRAGDLKLSNSQLGPKAELFNIHGNPGEDSSRALDLPDSRAALAREVDAWESGWAPPIPRLDGAADDE